MTVSIALCTYNGEKYLYEQLKSIAKYIIIHGLVFGKSKQFLCNINGSMALLYKRLIRSNDQIGSYLNNSMFL